MQIGPSKTVLKMFAKKSIADRDTCITYMLRLQYRDYGHIYLSNLDIDLEAFFEEWGLE